MDDVGGLPRESLSTGNDEHGAMDTRTDRDRAELRRLMDSVNWGTVPGRALPHRLVTVQPWSASVVPPEPHGGDGPADPALQILAKLGHEFDNTAVQPRFLRPFADYWCAWALPRFEKLSLAWARGAAPLDPGLMPAPVMRGSVVGS